MRNIFLLLKQFYNFFIFLFLEIICLYIVFSNNNYQQTSVINSARKISGNLFTQKEKLTGFFRLSKVNDSLLKENANLKSKLGISILKNPLKDTSYTASIKIDSTTQNIHYDYIPAKVLNNTIDQKINYITLNKGFADGIKKNMGVISDKGIVGKIVNVSEHYSIVTSMLSDRFTVSAKTSDGSVGKAIWDGVNPEFILLTGIPQSVKLKPLDTVLTSGYSSFFPENIMIGKVAKVESPTSYKIWLSTKFTNLHYVYIIKDEKNVERQTLEDSTITQ